MEIHRKIDPHRQNRQKSPCKPFSLGVVQVPTNKEKSPHGAKLGLTEAKKKAAIIAAKGKAPKFGACSIVFLCLRENLEHDLDKIPIRSEAIKANLKTGNEDPSNGGERCAAYKVFQNSHYLTPFKNPLKKGLFCYS